MSTQMGWMRTLGSIGSVLTVLVLLAGLILAVIAYVRGKNRIVLLGAIGFLLLFLFGCCSTAWGFADSPILRDMPPRSIRTYLGAKSVILFLASLGNLAGFVLLVVALWMSSKKE